jgi:hypothetical protein
VLSMFVPLGQVSKERIRKVSQCGMCHVLTLYHCKQEAMVFPAFTPEHRIMMMVQYKSSQETLLNMWGIRVSLKTRPSRSPCALTCAMCLRAHDVDQRWAHDLSRIVTSATPRKLLHLCQCQCLYKSCSMGRRLGWPTCVFGAM